MIATCVLTLRLRRLTCVKCSAPAARVAMEENQQFLDFSQALAG
jgi:hypothetical protein